jgi:threonine/homoserine/homoserine lactone efflux protein
VAREPDLSLDPTLAALVAFIAAAGLLTVTPGLDTALVLRTAAAEGPRRACLTALGIVIGCLCWAALTAIGLAALLAASRSVYTLLRLGGAAYLIWLGLGMIRHPRRGLDGGTSAKPGGAFTRGLLTNLLNPKVGVFYVSFLPGFVPHGAAVGPFILLLGAIHAFLGLLWFTCLIAATAPLARALGRPGVIATLDRATGGLFVLIGAGLAIESRLR